MKLALAAGALAVTIAGLIWMGLTVRDTIARGSGSRRDALLMRQKFALIAVLGIPVVMLSLWLLDIDLSRMWWLFALALIQVPVLIVASVQLRRDQEDSK